MIVRRKIENSERYNNNIGSHTNNMLNAHLPDNSGVDDII
jgi:hypothetical protein